MNRGAWWTTVCGVTEESDTTERPGVHTWDICLREGLLDDVVILFLVF